MFFLNYLVDPHRKVGVFLYDKEAEHYLKNLNSSPGVLNFFEFILCIIKIVLYLCVSNLKYVI
jgi:hypothetical protein